MNHSYSNCLELVRLRPLFQEVTLFVQAADKTFKISYLKYKQLKCTQQNLLQQSLNYILAYFMSNSLVCQISKKCFWVRTHLH